MTTLKWKANRKSQFAEGRTKQVQSLSISLTMFCYQKKKQYFFVEYFVAHEILNINLFCAVKIGHSEHQI